jgi:hypothetical protein
MVGSWTDDMQKKLSEIESWTDGMQKKLSEREIAIEREIVNSSSSVLGKEVIKTREINVCKEARRAMTDYFSARTRVYILWDEFGYEPPSKTM